MKILKKITPLLISLVPMVGWADFSPSIPTAASHFSNRNCPGPTDLAGMCLGQECKTESNGHFVFVLMNGSKNEHGGKFCTTYVNAWRNNQSYKSSATWYTATPNDVGVPSCVWLCENGWGGEECMQELASSNTEKMCASMKMSASLYTSLSVGTDDDDIYTSSGWSKKDDCNDTQFKRRSSDRDHEIEVTYGIISWLPSGHGARVGPIAARAFCGRGDTKSECKAIVFPTGTEAQKTILCMPGHVLNAAGTDCVVADGYQETCGYVTDCKGWDGANFASSDYVKITQGGCYQYRCAKPEHGFAGSPKTNRECIECPTGMRKGVSQIDGECVTAGAGYMFNPNAESKQTEITQAKALYSKDFLKTNAAGVPCWMSAESPDDFKKCLAGE